MTVAMLPDTFAAGVAWTVGVYVMGRAFVELWRCQRPHRKTWRS